MPHGSVARNLGSKTGHARRMGGIAYSIRFPVNHYLVSVCELMYVEDSSFVMFYTDL